MNIKSKFYNGEIDSMTITSKSSYIDYREGYILYITLEPIYPNNQTIEIPNRLSDIRCGFSDGLEHSISRLVCANINDISLEEFFDSNKECTSIGKKMSDNLIRVATQRIYSDPYRSFIEPVVNSIDAYNEMRGIPSTTGKFGMGFFSLLYWIINSGFIDIESVYELNGEKCLWNARITYSDSGFFFRLISSKMVDNLDTGTKITINSKSIDIKSLQEIIDGTFRLNADYTIMRLAQPGIYRNKANYPLHGMSGATYGIDVGDNIVLYDIVKSSNSELNVTFEDKATGISLSTFITKLLVPSISSKTITLSLSDKISYHGNMRSDIVLHKNTIGGFAILVRGIAIYNHSERRGKYLFVWVLPDQTPLPVSRDDVILENVIYYREAKESLFALLDIAIKYSINSPLVQILIDHLKRYADYSNNTIIYKLLGEFNEKLHSMEDVYRVLPKYISFYNNYIKPLTGKYYITTDNADIARLDNHIDTLELERDNTFDNRVILLINMDIDMTTGGTVSFLFVNKKFTEREDWKDDIISSRYIRLYNNNLELPDALKVLLDNRTSIRSLVKMVSDPRHAYEIQKYMRKCSDLIVSIVQTQNVSNVEGDVAYTILYNMFFSIIHKSLIIGSEPSYTEKVFKMFYTTLFTVVNRKVHNTTEKSTIIVYAAGLVDYREYDSEIIEYNDRKLIYDQYHLDYMWLFLDPLMYTQLARVSIFSIYDFIFPIRHTSTMVAIKIREFCCDKPAVYGFFINLLCDKLDDILNKYEERRKKDILDLLLNQIYTELSQKYGEKILKDMISKYVLMPYIFEDQIITLRNNLYLILVNIDKSINNGIYTIKYKEIDNTDFTFTANQLISYFFEYEVDRSNLDWISSVANHTTVTNFQSLEIAINEGTSKNYIDSVLTELTQNSIDAAREYISNNPDNTSLVDGRIVRKVFKDIKITAPDLLIINIGKIGEQGYGLSVKDNIGIPPEGIVAILLPFYSSKSATNVLSSGEMGTGFMNVYRQPYCEEVRIVTNGVIINVVPVLDKYNRAVDLNYRFTRTNSKNIGTTITILFRKEYGLTLINDGIIFSYTFLRSLDMMCSINGKTLLLNKKKLFNNKTATVYLVKKNFRSIILSNGVPYSLLKPYIPNDNLAKYLELNIVIDLHKDSFKPVQSRKRVIFNDQVNIENTLYLAAILNAIYRLVDRGESDDINFPNMRYKGDPRQSKMSTSTALKNMRLCNVQIKTDGMVIPAISTFVNSIVDNPTLPINVTMNNDAMSAIIEKTADLLFGNNTIDYVKQQYIHFVKKWFSNKIIVAISIETKISGEVEKVTNVEELMKGGIVTSKLVRVDSELYNFTNKIVKYCWYNALNLIKRGILVGFNINRDAPRVYFEENTDKLLHGHYNVKKHTIYINVFSINQDKLLASIRKYKTLYRDKNPQEAENFVNNDESLNMFIGRRNQPTTLIHEFMHAVKNEHHLDNAHGDISFKFGNEEYADETFFSACNELWFILVRKFNPCLA